MKRSGRALARDPLPPSWLAWSVWGLAALLYLAGFYQRVAPAVITDQLMAEFSIGAAALGNLSGFYFYSYVMMQVPTGVIADRWGPRRLLTLGAAGAALGTALFAAATSLWWADAGRLLIGASVAVAFVSMLKLTSHWFAPHRYPLVSGMALLMGVTGGVVAGVPLRLLVEAYGWREVMGASAGLTALLCAAIWLWVKDDPEDAGYASHFSGGHEGHPDGHPGGHSGHTPVVKGLAEVLSYRNSWILLLVQVGLSGAVLCFGGLWGVPYLRQVYGLDAKSAAVITSALLIAWALGGPLLGTWSQRLGRRKPLYVLTTALALGGWTAIVFLPLPLWLLVLVLMAAGFAAGNIIIGFAWAKESVPLRLTGTASGFCNMGSLIGGMLLQPGVGWMLDRHWHGAGAGGARIYDAAAYQAGFSLILVAIASSLLLILFSRESRCVQIL